jgi:hypothetical protein
VLLKIIYGYEYEYTKFLWILSVGSPVNNQRTFYQYIEQRPEGWFTLSFQKIFRRPPVRPQQDIERTPVMLFVASIKASSIIIITYTTEKLERWAKSLWEYLSYDPRAWEGDFSAVDPQAATFDYPYPHQPFILTRHRSSRGQWITITNSSQSSYSMRLSSSLPIVIPIWINEHNTNLSTCYGRTIRWSHFEEMIESSREQRWSW